MKLNDRILIGILAFSVACLSGCKCPAPPPPRPTSVRGWQEWNDSYTHYIGELVLDKGKSSDNGRIGVRVIDILPGKCVSVFGEPTPARVKFQFYNLSDRQIVCELLTSSGDALDCDGIEDVHSVRLLGIDDKDGWAHFTLY